jgi:hypothetical protein
MSESNTLRKQELLNLSDKRAVHIQAKWICRPGVYILTNICVCECFVYIDEGKKGDCACESDTLAADKDEDINSIF